MYVYSTLADVVLEPASQAFVEATAKPPFLYELTPDEARAVLDDVQAAPIHKLPVAGRWVTVPADVGDVRVRIVRPPDAAQLSRRAQDQVAAGAGPPARFCDHAQHDPGPDRPA